MNDESALSESEMSRIEKILARWDKPRLLSPRVPSIAGAPDKGKLTYWKAHFKTLDGLSCIENVEGLVSSPPPTFKRAAKSKGTWKVPSGAVIDLPEVTLEVRVYQLREWKALGSNGQSDAPKVLHAYYEEVGQ